jgi:ubiquinone biosynthesis protein UbiJ
LSTFADNAPSQKAQLFGQISDQITASDRASSANQRCEAKMTEFDELKAEVAALRAEVDKWKAITIDVLGKASRAQGFAEGVGEGARMQLDALNGRVTMLEMSQNNKPLPFGMTYLAPSPNSGETL